MARTSSQRGGSSSGWAFGGDLLAAVDRARGADVGELDEAVMRSHLKDVEVAVRRLQAWQSKLMAELQRRRAEAAAARAREKAGASDEAAEDRARREADRAAKRERDEISDDLNQDPSETKRKTEDADRLSGWAEIRAAFENGEFDGRHLRQIEWVLDAVPVEEREEVAVRLLAAARSEGAVAFGRTCRAIVAEFSPDEAARGVEKQERRRSLKVAQRPDGMMGVSGVLPQLEGAFLQEALSAFRRRDVHGEYRKPEQRTCDALSDLVRAAAGTIGDPNARHGVPVFVIQLPADRLLSEGEISRLRAGNGTETFTGPLPLTELTRLLGSSHIAAVLADARGVPLAATEQKRAVPVGLWRALVARDRGCVRVGCVHPAGWCQAAHLGDWYADGGLLSPLTAGLLCSQHHAAYDRGQLSVTWIDDRPHVHRHGDIPAGAETAASVRTRRGGRHGPEQESARRDHQRTARPDPTDSGSPPGRTEEPDLLDPTDGGSPPGQAEQPDLFDLAGETRGAYDARPRAGTAVPDRDAHRPRGPSPTSPGANRSTAPGRGRRASGDRARQVPQARV